MATEPERSTQEIGRREFLDYLIGGSFLITGLSILGSVVRYAFPPVAASSGEGGPVEVAAVAEITPGTGKILPFRDTSIVVVNAPDRFVALSAVCTHAGCVVEYNPQTKQIDCPCHGGVFDLQGNVLAGPPPKPLPQFRVEVKGDKLVVGVT
jgi:cytochrome b6-f complex iron-sulfur subunit